MYTVSMSFITNIIDETQKNENFRTVLFTGEKSQLVTMSIPPGGEIGEETHDHVEQALFFLGGSGKVVLNGEESKVGAGDVLVVSPGVQHNVVNVSDSEPLKIYTVYSPANHVDGRVHSTKADADSDSEDEAFGEAVR